MTTNKKQWETLLFSVVGVAAMFFILVALYVISGVAKIRVDLTEEQLYTLSPGTKALLSKLDTPVEFRFYCTMDSKEMPIHLKTYAQRVEDLLSEYRKASKGMIDVKRFDPKPDTDAEDSAQLDGIEGQMVNLGDKIYLGLAISQLDSKAAIPFLSPDKEKLLEYDITRAISQVTITDRPVIGVMTALPAFGEINPMAMRMGQMQRQDPWVFISELKKDYEVKQIETTADDIPSDVKLLMVVHPKNLTDKTLYAIDQFLMKGGKLIAFLDPLSMVDSRNTPGMNPLQAASMAGSSLDKLTKAWGIEYDVNKVAADMEFITRINRPGGGPERAPAVLSLNQLAFNSDDVITSEIDNALIPFPGVFTGTPIEGLKQTVLMQTSERSQLVERFMAEFSGEQTVKDFSPSGKQYAMALRLTGKFKSAFPDGKPKETPADNAEQTEQEKAAAGAHLKESEAETAVILVGDTDFLFDQFSVQIQDFFGHRIIIPRNGNLNLVQNMVDQMAGDSSLIGIRSRATQNRPFTVVKQMQAQAEERYRSKIKELEAGLQETQTRLNELQQNKESGQRFILSPEQQAEIQKFQAKQVEANKELREVRRNLRKDIDSMENKLKWINIAGMPLLVTISGIALAIVKRKKTAAK